MTAAPCPRRDVSRGAATGAWAGSAFSSTAHGPQGFLFLLISRFSGRRCLCCGGKRASSSQCLRLRFGFPSFCQVQVRSAPSRLHSAWGMTSSFDIGACPSLPRVSGAEPVCARHGPRRLPRRGPPAAPSWQEGARRAGPGRLTSPHRRSGLGTRSRGTPSYTSAAYFPRAPAHTGVCAAVPGDDAGYAGRGLLLLSLLCSSLHFISLKQCKNEYVIFKKPCFTKM